MENREELLDALNDFNRKQTKEIPPLLEQFLKQVAKTGETLFPWSQLKVLILAKMEQVMIQFCEEYGSDHLPPCPNVENVRSEVVRSRIMDTVQKFHGAPFTIQRLCELLTDPRRHYKRCDKFLRGLEKNVLVVSTVDPFGRKVVSESKSMVNGMDSTGSFQQADTSTPQSTPPVPAWNNSSPSLTWNPSGECTATDAPTSASILEVAESPEPKDSIPVPAANLDQVIHISTTALDTTTKECKAGAVDSANFNAILNGDDTQLVVKSGMTGFECSEKTEHVETTGGNDALLEESQQSEAAVLMMAPTEAPLITEDCQQTAGTNSDTATVIADPCATILEGPESYKKMSVGALEGSHLCCEKVSDKNSLTVLDQVNEGSEKATQSAEELGKREEINCLDGISKYEHTLCNREDSSLDISAEGSSTEVASSFDAIAVESSNLSDTTSFPQEVARAVTIEEETSSKQENMDTSVAECMDVGTTDSVSELHTHIENDNAVIEEASHNSDSMQISVQEVPMEEY